jgi:hypothetical protein
MYIHRYRDSFVEHFFQNIKKWKKAFFIGREKRTLVK